MSLLESVWVSQVLVFAWFELNTVQALGKRSAWSALQITSKHCTYFSSEDRSVPEEMQHRDSLSSLGEHY